MSPVWWEGLDGKKVLFWNARGYGQTNPLFGQPTRSLQAMTCCRYFCASIPVMRGDGAPYWEDGIASDAFYAAMERANEKAAPF